ncbi:MAG: EamA family transporter [Clostridia bacterium]|nr:EamA family transporter [Clostridia bacterium]
MKRFFSPELKLIFSMVVFGTIGVFVKNINLPSQEIALYRALLASLLILGILLLSKKKFSFKEIKKALPLLIISGVAIGFNWIFLFEAYKYTTVSVATLSYYFAPVIVTIACPILFKEKFGVKEIICFVFSTIGIVLITGIGDLSNSSNHLLGVLFGLIAAVLYASVVLINKFITVDGLYRTFFQFLSAVIVLTPYVIFTGGFTITTLNTNGFILLLIVGLVHTGITYYLYFTSIKELSGQKTAILSYIDPLVAIILSVTLLAEELTLLQIIGGALILGFTLFYELSSKKQK